MSITAIHTNLFIPSFSFRLRVLSLAGTCRGRLKNDRAAITRARTGAGG
jgi:hypothetical protein